MRILNHSILNKIDNHNFIVKSILLLGVGTNAYVARAQSAAFTYYMYVFMVLH